MSHDFIRGRENDLAQQLLVKLVESRDVLHSSLAEPVFRAGELAIRSVALADGHRNGGPRVDQVEPFALAGEIGAGDCVRKTGILLLQDVVEVPLELRWIEGVDLAHGR